MGKIETKEGKEKPNNITLSPLGPPGFLNEKNPQNLIFFGRTWGTLLNFLLGPPPSGKPPPQLILRNGDCVSPQKQLWYQTCFPEPVWIHTGFGNETAVVPHRIRETKSPPGCCRVVFQIARVVLGLFSGCFHFRSGCFPVPPGPCPAGHFDMLCSGRNSQKKDFQLKHALFPFPTTTTEREPAEGAPGASRVLPILRLSAARVLPGCCQAYAPGKANDWRHWGNRFLDLFSNFKWARTRGYFIEPWSRILVLSGPLLVSRTGDAG